MRSKHRLYINADKTAIVPEDSDQAAYLLVPAGGEISAEDIKKFGLKKADLIDDDAVEDPADEPEAKAKAAPPENKARHAANETKAKAGK